MIELKNISVDFPNAKGAKGENEDFHAVKNVSLTVEAGEIFGIVGYSGAGKSTLLRVINQLQKQSSGEVYVNGQNMSALKPKELRQARRKIGMIFQSFNLLKQLTVAENIALPLKFTGMPKAKIAERVDYLLDLVNLKSHKNHYPAQLSGGQSQRVSIARALADQPEILLCDEATSALDPQTTDSILKLLKQINQRFGITIVLITHEMAVIKEICDRVAVMQDGEIIETGAVCDIFTRPERDLTKKFIASASSTEQGILNILQHPENLKLNSKDKLIRIDFADDSAGEPIIATLARDYRVLPSILFGNVEFIQNRSVGTLLVSLSGDSEDLKKAVNYVASENVTLHEY